MKPELVCTAPVHFLPDIQAELKRRYKTAFAFNASREKVARLLPKARAVMTNPGTPFPYDGRLLSLAPKLEIVVTPSTGSDHIDVAWCRGRGIAVDALRGHEEHIENIHASAEFSFALLLAMIRRLPQASASALSGRWREIEDRFRGIELAEKTVGLVGFGRIGRKMARYCAAFGASVLAYDPYVKAAGSGVRQTATLDELLASSDIVCLHLHLDDSTRGMFGPDRFAKMKRGAYFLNTARGAIVDEKALVASLRAGRLAAAAVDVIQGEQAGGPAKSPLVAYARKHDNLLITPHIAGLTVDSQRKAALFALERLKLHFNKEKP